MKVKNIALVGNPNSGKTSLFNILTGSNQTVGNWPGVTVEKKAGKLKNNSAVILQDLPGIYSLSPYTPEEIVARDYLLSYQSDCLVNIVDASNLERSLYLTTQLLELGLPVVLVLNMIDLVEKRGIIINDEKLAYVLDVPISRVSVIKNKGLQRVVTQIDNHQNIPKVPTYDSRLEVALSEISDCLPREILSTQKRWYSIKLFERDQHVCHQLSLSEDHYQEIEEIIEITEKIFKDDSESIMINERYKLIEQLINLCCVESKEAKASLSDQIDRVVTNRWLALPIFASIMWLVYFLSIQTLGTLGTDWMNDQLFGEWVPRVVSKLLVSWGIAPWLQSLILDGIIAGVGAVLGFLPQLIVLFLCLSFLEDCGYMSRIAFVMDRFFRRFGLSGKSFIPMLISTGCGVPGIMACRTIENERDRKLTMITTTFMPCSAKLPIIGLIAGAFFPEQSWVAPSAYFVSMSTIVLSGIILKKISLFHGDTAPFIMELPDYHLPRIENSIRQTWLRSKSFVKKAGTVIFASSVIIWGLSSFSFSGTMVTPNHSILASMGRVLAPLFSPLGWGSWQATVATMTGLVAKENVVGTLGVLIGRTGEVSELGKEYWTMLSTSMSPVAGYSFLLFNLLCAPCFAAIGALHREMADWKWTIIAIGYQSLAAYLVSFIAYQIGHFVFEHGEFDVWVVVALIVLVMMVYLIKRQPKEMNKKIVGIEVL